jgi:PD-(D/E)XK nuclease superfamily
MSTPLPWSHSSLAGFDTCARQYEEIKVLRNYQDAKNAASLWGDKFHKIAEGYIGAKVASGQAVLTSDTEQYRAYLDKFAARPGRTLVEQEYGLDIQLRPCAFLGPDVWMRGVIDVLNIDGTVANVDDHKTGKNRKKDQQQLIIFALLTFYHHPEVMCCHTAFHWLQFGPDAVDRETYYRHDMGWMWDTLVPKLRDYRDAFHRGVFPAKPSGLCKKHCAVDSCEYFGRGPRG